MDGKKNSVMYDDFVVINAAGARVVGLVNGDFTRSLYNPVNAEVSGVITVTITELGGGSYRARYTPNASGLWKLDIFQATHFPEGKTANHQIYDANIDTVGAKLPTNYIMGSPDAADKLIVTGTPIVPYSVDLAATSAVYFGIMLSTNRGAVPTTAEITPGTFYIHRKAKGATSWTTMRNGVALEEVTGYVRYGEIFSAASGYAEGDSLRIGFAGVSVVINGVTYEVCTATPGAYYHTHIRETGVKEMYVKLPTNYIMGSSDVDNHDTDIDSILSAVEGIGTAGGAAINVDTAVDNYASGQGAVCAVVQATGVCTPVVNPVWVINALAGKRILLNAVWYTISSNTETTCTITGAPANGNYTWRVEGISGVTIDTPKIGTQTGTYINTSNVNGVYHVMTHESQVVDIVYEFLTGGGTSPVSCVWTGILNPINDTASVYAWNHVGGTWEMIGSIAGQTLTTSNIVKNMTLFARHRGTSSAELGKVYIRITSSAVYNHILRTDQIVVSYAVTSRTVGYADGAVWVKATGTAGTELYVNGTADNPCPWANALTIAAALGISRFRIKNGELVTLTAGLTNCTLIGNLWALNLAGQVVDDCYFDNASVYGSCTSSPTKTPFFRNCKIADIGAVSTNGAYFVGCMLVGNITLSEVGNYTFENCIDGTPGVTTNPVIIFTAGAVSAGFRNWSGGIQFNTITTDNMIAIEGNGRIILHTDCHHGGTLIIRGHSGLTDNSGGFVAGGGSLTQTERFDTVTQDLMHGHLDTIVTKLPTNYIMGSSVATDKDDEIDYLYNIEGGKWKIEANQMIFYKSDNLTEVARFNLKDSTGNPAMSNVYERSRV